MFFESYKTFYIFLPAPVTKSSPRAKVQVYRMQNHFCSRGDRHQVFVTIFEASHIRHRIAKNKNPLKRTV
jgi:hypothetical protein